MPTANKSKVPASELPDIIVPKGIKPRREDFIAHLANKFNWTMGCELGIWKGRTFLHLLKNCPHLTVIGVDLWAPQPDNTGPENYIHWNHEQHEQIVRQASSSFGDRAIIYKMYTHEAVKKVKPGTLDFIFIDADHSSQAVRTDLLDWIPKLKSTGMIIGHDINWVSVKCVVDEIVPGYKVGPDNVWFRTKNPHNPIFQEF